MRQKLERNEEKWWGGGGRQFSLVKIDACRVQGLLFDDVMGQRKILSPSKTLGT